MFNQRPNKKGGINDGDAIAFVAAGGIVVVALVVFLIVWASAALAGHGQGGPVQWVLGQGTGPRWSTTATLWSILFGSLLGAFVVALVRSIRRAIANREWTDSLASSMSSKRDLAEMTEKAVTADTERLGSQAAGRGVPRGVAVLTREWLYGTYEWSQVWIMGTRAGKTRSVAVPQLVEHGGAAVTTSNKPDIVYLTRGPRSELGRCWIQDPQGIYGEGPTWWWNPLTFVTSLDRAEELASIWLASRSTGEIPKEDAYFGPMGRELLTALVLAAAVGRQPVTRVLEWLDFPDGRPGLPDPQEILRAQGFHGVADGIESKINAAPEERSGLFGTARSGVGFLRNPDYLPWVTRMGPEDDRPEFSPEEFVTTTQTLYLLSKGGKSSGARAITGSLTAAVYAAAERRAERSPGARLPTPVLFVLDEAANVCRWPELPELYSHAGGKGIILIVILQSKKQGESAWGEGGFGMMWSYANISVAGRGLNDDDHLGELSRLIGTRQIRDRSRTVGQQGHRSMSTQNRDERIFDEADLRAFPRGRAVLFAAGARAILLGVVDFSQRADADRIEASREAFRQPWHQDDYRMDDGGDAVAPWLLGDHEPVGEAS